MEAPQAELTGDHIHSEEKGGNEAADTEIVFVLVVVNIAADYHKRKGNRKVL